MEEPMRIDDLINRVTALHPDGAPLVHLSDAIAQSKLIEEMSDQLVEHFVDAARKAGATWAEIGGTMGITRQAVQKRFVPSPAGFSAPLAVATDRFTLRARAVIAASEEEARTARHNYVGTEHIVLGLLSQPEGLAAKALAEKTTPEQLRAAMTGAFGPMALR
jgi:ATP-dependent Clp protease ATP-binding subunit ClpA